MRIKYVVMLAGAMTCSLFCTGCSSPYLPHNAFKYIPEFRLSGYEAEEKEDNIPEEDLKGGETVMETESLGHRSYFSPDSIRTRYAEHIQNESAESNDLLLDIARDTVELMQQDGKNEEEIRLVLKNKFHFSDEIIDVLVEE
ncbi:MAG: hypothetical protein NC305_16040 [Lachnospiraceae bacterium]|nr:hypothetical protein [Butyrivibrio sp.]MCM1412038.1 hypothetical protein [Lachnospiraceae bacterium]